MRHSGKFDRYLAIYKEYGYFYFEYGNSIVILFRKNKSLSFQILIEIQIKWYNVWNFSQYNEQGGVGRVYMK